MVVRRIRVGASNLSSRTLSSRTIGNIIVPRGHPCSKFKSCGIVVSLDGDQSSYSAEGLLYSISHKIEDKWDLVYLRCRPVDERLAILDKLAHMHMIQDKGFRVCSVKPITPYISFAEATEMASEIFNHTGERVTICHSEVVGG